MLPQVTRPLSCFSLQKALLTRDSAEVTAGAVTEQASPPAVTGSVSYRALGLAESVSCWKLGGVVASTPEEYGDSDEPATPQASQPYGGS